MQKKSLFISAILFTLCTISFFSCKYDQGDQIVNVNNKFSISIPGWMKEVNDLKPGAEFQYANRYRNFYAIGTADTKQKPIGDVMNDNLNILRKSMKGPVVTDSTDITVSGLKGLRVEIYGKMSDENIYFSEVLLEGPANLYHLSIWTRAEDRKLRFKETINGIINSFKPI